MLEKKSNEFKRQYMGENASNDNEKNEVTIFLDDVFAELDVMRRATILELTRNAPQVFITAAVESDVPAELGGARFHVSLGTVTHVKESHE